MKKILRIALVLAGVLAVGFIALVVIYFIQKKPLYYTAYENASRYSDGSCSLDAEAIDAIDVSWLSGTVQFTKAAGNTLNVTEADQGLTDKQRVRWWLDGRTLRIQYWASGYGADKDMNKTLRMEIPDGVSLTVQAQKGAIKMGSHQLSDLNVQIRTGDIEAGTLTIGQGLTLENGGGATSIRGVTAQEAQFKTTLGEIRIDSIAVRGSLTMKSTWAKLSLGTVQAKTVKIEKYQGIQMGLGQCGTVEMYTNMGNIALTVRQNVGATVNFTTEGGGKLNGKSVKDSAQLVVGDGACVVNIHAESGNLTVSY